MKFKNALRSAIFLCFSLAYMTAFPAWINFEPQTITQPDGTVIHCFATGDEYYNWLHNQEGFTIIQNHQDGYYYYAVLDGDQLVPSTFKAGTIDPASSWACSMDQYIQAMRWRPSGLISSKTICRPNSRYRDILLLIIPRTKVF